MRKGGSGKRQNTESSIEKAERKGELEGRRGSVRSGDAVLPDKEKKGKPMKEKEEWLSNRSGNEGLKEVA